MRYHNGPMRRVKLTLQHRIDDLMALMPATKDRHESAVRVTNGADLRRAIAPIQSILEELKRCSG